MMIKFKNRYGQLPNTFYTKMPAEGFSNTPQLIHLNELALPLIGLNPKDIDKLEFTRYFSGNFSLPGSDSLAMVYSGFQFGQWAGQLGDGRALLLGQTYTSKHGNWDIQLKGAGKTPYSRFGDGRAVLRSSIREYLASEAMAALGVPTSRALCLIGTGEQVQRESLEPGAILTRLAHTHIRFGHFEHFFYHFKTEEYLKILVDHVIDIYFPTCKSKNNPYTAWFLEVTKRTAYLIAHWQSIGFCHGVMNTDNMSILGETLDYGPYGFIEAFDPGHICNHSDHEGRYAFDQQPDIALWNLKALAYALSPLISKIESDKILSLFPTYFHRHYKLLMFKKLSFTQNSPQNAILLTELLTLMASQKSDYTLTFSHLSTSFITPKTWLSLFKYPEPAQRWLTKYHSQKIDIDNLNPSNPRFIPRNWVAECIIREVEDNQNYTHLDDMLKVFQSPFQEHPLFKAYTQTAPENLKHLYISCSS